MKIAVLAGGYSPERDVSLTSGSLIATSLSKSGHMVALADIYKSIDKNKIPDMFAENKTYSYKIPGTPPDLEKLKAESGNGERLIGDGILELCLYADVVFLALHGGMGEDGHIQAILECYGVKFTGSSFSGCHVAMDKSLSKTVFRAASVPTADWTMWNKGDPVPKVKLPCVVKPCSCGSSVGVSIVETAEELEAALEFAEKYENKVLIEDKITGREFSIGVLDGKALPAIEIRPKAKFYDYQRKYQAGMTDEICPADISAEQEKKIGGYAVAAHKALGLGSYSRLDFILDSSTGDFVCLEANTLPGMTPTSLLPQEAAAAGINYDKLCNVIVNLAMK